MTRENLTLRSAPRGSSKKGAHTTSHTPKNNNRGMRPALTLAVLFALAASSAAYYSQAGPGADGSAIDWWLWQTEESVKVRIAPWAASRRAEKNSRLFFFFGVHQHTHP